MEGKETPYGIKDVSYKTAGELEGISRLVDAFYTYMDTVEEAKHIRSLHPEDLDFSREKLTFFLCGWLGGPRLYQEKYGPINIPAIHQSLGVGTSERDTWLSCMELAIADQDYSESFKTYLLEKLSIPAERIRVVCEKSSHS